MDPTDFNRVVKDAYWTVLVNSPCDIEQYHKNKVIISGKIFAYFREHYGYTLTQQVMHWLEVELGICPQHFLALVKKEQAEVVYQALYTILTPEQLCEFFKRNVDEPPTQFCEDCHTFSSQPCRPKRKK